MYCFQIFSLLAHLTAFKSHKNPQCGINIPDFTDGVTEAKYHACLPQLLSDKLGTEIQL